MPTVRYSTIDGEVIAEKRNGVRKLYLPDPLGATVALLDNTQSLTDTFAYWPYGEVRTRTGSTPTPFQFVGTVGYYNDSSVRTYVRARYLSTKQARWQTQDPIGFTNKEWNLYGYVLNNAVSNRDPSGLVTWTCEQVLSCLKSTTPYNCKPGSGCHGKPNSEVDTYLAVCVAWQESCFQDPISSCGDKSTGGMLQITCGRITDINAAGCNPGHCLCNGDGQIRKPKDECPWIQAGFRWLQCGGLDTFGPPYSDHKKNALRACASCLRTKGCSQWSQCRRGVHR